ncbi:hypothetical protein TNCV_1392681, partial [Trichonephila clavipes]
MQATPRSSFAFVQDLIERTSIQSSLVYDFPEDSWAHGPGSQPAARQDELVNNNNNGLNLRHKYINELHWNYL